MKKRLRLVRCCKYFFGAAFLLAVVWSGILYIRQRARVSSRLEMSSCYEAEKEAARGENNEEPANAVSRAAVHFQSLNPDYIGWLKVDGTKVDYPVVQGTDNTFYLDHNFYRENDAAGAIFADAQTPHEKDGNILIYGHHMRDESMFGSLELFTKQEFFEQHGYIQWDNTEESGLYEVFAVLVIPGAPDAADYFPIQDFLKELDEERLAELETELRERAIYWRELPQAEEEPYLFLITCNYSRQNGRLLLCARRSA